MIIKPEIIKRAKIICKKGLDAQVFTIEDIASATKLTVFTVRDLIKREHVDIKHPPQSGQGVKAYYAFTDSLSFFAASAVLRLGIKPRYLHTKFIRNHLIFHIQAIADNDKSKIEQSLFTIIAESTDVQYAAMMRNTPAPPQESGYISWITVDCHQLSLEVIEIAYHFF